MPIYEYECRQGHISERIVSNSCDGVSTEWSATRCDKCGGFALRIMSAPAPPVMGGMVYRPDPNKPLASRAEVKVPLRDIQARDNRLRERMLKRAGKATTPTPDMVKP